MGRRGIASALLLAALLLTAAAWRRSAEYDEQYTLFLTGSATRPTWSDVVTAGDVRALQAASASFTTIARDLRSMDVHPPLYFWMLAEWRSVMGDSLVAARLASVLFSVGTLTLVAVIARSAGIPTIPAVLLTLGCYGFAYTSAIARGFALAQLLLVAGVAVLLSARGVGRSLAAGALLGAATFVNYLAAFVAVAVMLWLLLRRPLAMTVAAVLGLAAWLPADLWFFLAQRHSRVGQFPTFGPIAAVTRLARYSAATVFGGLPLYVHGVARAVVATALSLLLVILIAIAIRHWRYILRPETRLLLAMAAAAPPIGLLLLGFAFDNTPIELRYLAFSTPFIGLLLAAALPRSVRRVVLAVQALALLGLMTRPETMQPARATAMAAASFVGDGIVLLPRGNDGIGIVGAFAIEAPKTLRLMVVSRNESPVQIRAQAANYPRIVLALLAQDAASRATLPVMREAFTDECWRAAGSGSNVLAFERICREQGTQPAP